MGDFDIVIFLYNLSSSTAILGVKIFFYRNLVTGVINLLSLI